MESSDSESLPPDRPSSLQICSYEEYKANDIKARQRASVLWLVSKACENTLPNDLKDPYYRDHEDQDRLKPMIIQGLSTGALYCSALANIYADPNYHSLNHHGILQVLMRKGVHVEEPSDMPLTETVLTQTAPIRMSAHMAVIEGIMALFIKEVLIPEKVVEVVSRFSTVEATHEIPNDAEEAAVLWINKCCVKLQHRIEEEMGSFHSPEESDPRQVSHRSPNVPIIQDLADLSDGCSLAAVLSFYCPDYLPWQEISFNEPVSLADSLYNLQLVQRFCEDQLPHDICFLTLEDFLYMHDTIKQCTLAYLADLMFLFEIRPARCVVRPGVKEDLEPVKQQSSAFEAHRRHSHNGRDHRLRSFQQAVSPIPDLRSGGSVSSYGGSSFSLPDIHRISPRSNGPIPVRDKTIERSPSARKIRGHEGSKSPISPTSSLRRTNSVNLPDSDRRRSKSYPDSSIAAGLPSKVNHEEVRQKSDEDEEIAAYFTNRDTSLPFDTQPSSQVRRELFPPDGQVPGNGKEGLEPLRPAYVKQSKERSNHDTKVQERGEDRRGSGPVSLVSKESGSPPEGYKIPEVIQRRKEVEDEYGTSPSQKQHPILSEGNSRLSTGLADYYQQLAEETRVEDLVSKSASGSPAKTQTTWQKDIMMAKLAEFTEKAALENVDPYSSNLATTSFAQLSKLRDGNPNPAINIVYMQHDKEGRYQDGGLSGETVAPAGSTSNPSKALKSSFLQKSRVERSQTEDRHTSFATLPNTTTWQQQSGIRNRESSQTEENPEDSPPLAAQLNDIRLQLEERRRKIEQEKRRMETMLKKQRQKLGKAAFLQAVSKPGTAQTPADGDSSSDNSERLVSPKESSANGILPLQSNSGQVSIKDIENDIDSVTRKWLKPGAMAGIVSPDQTSPLEDSVSDDVINTEDFQNSIEQLNSSLSDLQADISRLSQRQYSIQDLAPSGGKILEEQQQQPQQNFFLHKSASAHKPADFQKSVFQSQRQQQQQAPPPQQQQQGFVPSPRRGQWQNETPPNQLISNMYSPSPQQQISPQVINTNTSPRRGQWGQPLPPHMTPPDQYQIPWQPHPMRPASVDPQHMMHGHQMHHPAYDHRSPSAVPFMDSRNQGYPLHDGYGYQYPHHQPGMYQNGPVPGQYDYNRGYGAGGNIPPQPPMGHYDPMGNYPVMNYPQQPPHQMPGPHHQQSFRLGQENQMNPNYSHQPQQPNTQIQQQASNFQPIVPDRDMNYREETSGRSQQTSTTVDDFGRPVRSSISPERSPPSPPSKPMIGRTFRIPKGKSGGISPTKESSSPPRNIRDTEVEEEPENVSNSPPKNGPSEGGDGTDNTHFYISFDNDQPKKPKPKKPMRPREVKAMSAASKVNGKQGSSQDQSSGDTGSDTTRKSPPLPTSLSGGGAVNTQASSGAGDSGSEGRPQPAPRTRTQSVDEAGVGFFIGADLVNPDPEAECEMQKKKELIMMLSLRRRAEQESQRLTKEQEYAMQREQERTKQEEKDRKKEEERIRRQQILENYRMRRQQEELEKDGGGPADNASSSSRGHGGSRPGTLTKAKPRSTSATRPRPKSVHVTTHTREPTPLSSLDTMSRGSHLSLAGLDYQDDKDSLFSVGSGGTLTHRTLSPQSENSGPSRQLTSPTSSGGGCRGPYLPPGFVPHHRTGPPSDGASDAGSTTSSAFTDYTGPKLFVKPAAKSNRGIILNAINTVLAGSVNSETKRKVLDEINRSESKHFLILFRDSGCQFRAMYSYNPDKEEVVKLYGIGPKVITAKMMDRFYKYNSGGKCFSEVQTKHLTVTIDAITIQNHLWSGKRAMAQKKDLF